MNAATIPDHVRDWIADALFAADSGQPEPHPHGLTDEDLAEARRILADIPSEVDVDIPPLAEDPIAVLLGIVPEPPPVAVDAAAIDAALQDIDMDRLLADLAHYGHSVGSDWLNGLRNGTVKTLTPHVLRILTALLEMSPSRLSRDGPEHDRSRDDH